MSTVHQKVVGQIYDYGGAGGGSATWGAIGGDIANQIDLTNLLGSYLLSANFVWGFMGGNIELQTDLINKLNGYVLLNGTGAIGTWNISITGNATSASIATQATVLQNPRNFELTGVVTATPVSFDGSTNVTFNTAIAPNALNIGMVSGLAGDLANKAALEHSHGTPDFINNSVTNEKLAAMNASTIKGRLGTTGDPQDLIPEEVRSIINVADGATANSDDATLLDRANHTGTQGITTITMNTDRLLGRDTASAGAVEEITIGSGLSLSGGELSATGGAGLSDGDYGDITVGGTGTTMTIDNDVVTNAKAANMANSTIKARVTAGTGDPEDATLSQVLDLVGSAADGDILIRSSGSWTRLAVGSTDDILRVVAGVPAWVAPQVTYAALGSNYTNATTTGTEVTGLQKTLATGTYMFEYFIQFQCTSGSNSAKVGINFTGTASHFNALLRLPTTGSTGLPTDTTGIMDGQTTANPTIMGGNATRTFTTTAPDMGPIGNIDTANADLFLVVEGVITVTAGGDLELWYGSEINSTSTLLAGGTCLRLTKVA